MGRDAGSSHASLLLPTKTPAPSYSAHALCLVFRSGMVSGQKRPMLCQVIWGEKKIVSSFPSPAATQLCREGDTG